MPPFDDDDGEKTNVSKMGDVVRELMSRGQRDRAYLIVLQGSNVGEMYRLEAGESVLGRGTAATIRLGDDGISRRHARVIVENNAVRIEDLGSSNGTLVNGQLIQNQGLRDGDKIQLGSTTILKFTYHDKLEENFQRAMYDAALRDDLTKAFNKKYFLDRLEQEVAFARRHGSSLSLLMFDVDLFKRINDTFGHVAGDQVLARLAQVTQSTVRAEDVFGRYGGEEFAVLCRGIALGDAATMAERLRATVAGTQFVYEAGLIPVTISIGVAAYPEVAVQNGIELIAAADEALYGAKRSGRNRVVIKQ
ncbi:MAG TPA: GGDEF domain-containing protein [Polyangiaceae bacterium]|jgi:diguanylate cyclase (GGDEF)-like protein